ncbi:MAG: hypothetical protein ABI823_15750 [Bryobacteraceae bacterium]
MAVAGAFLAGGWIWALPCAVVAALWWRSGGSAGALATACRISAFWLVAFVLTGDRRLYFPYTLQFAVQASCFLGGPALRAGVFGAGGIVALFTAVRLVQAASARVLTVELAVAIPSLALCLAFYEEGSPTLQRRLAAAGVASLLGFLGLAL